MKLLLVFNPGASSGRALGRLTAIERAFAEHNIQHELVMTESPGHAIQIVSKATLSAYDGLISAGGDGTLFEVLNGLYEHNKQAHIPLGVIPIGTGNAFSRDLGLRPGDWQGAVNLIAQGNVRQVDVARVDTGSERFYFLNIIGMGFAVDAGLTAVRFKPLGRVAYTLGTLWQTLKLASYPLRIQLDGQVIEQDNVFVEISNTRYTGTSFLMAPSAKMDDGLLDVILLRRLSRLRLLRLFPSIYSGRHVNYEEVTVRKAKVIRLLRPRQLPLAVDGEFRGESPAVITCLHRDLTLFGC